MILGVTPARGGSRGIPRKNLRPLAGKPLLAWTIEQARASKRLDAYVVSTEDAEIADVAMKMGVETTRRPAHLARDFVSTGEVLANLVDQYPAADAVVVLQATSPIRREGLIDECIARFEASGADSLCTGSWRRHNPYKKLRGWDVPRQLQRHDFQEDGSVYVIRADCLRRGDRYGAEKELVETDRCQNVDVDDAFDFWLAEQIIQLGVGGPQGWP